MNINVPSNTTPQSNEHHCKSLVTQQENHHSDKTKHNLDTRLNRIEGQIRGIKVLIERDTYCDDVITQPRQL